MAARELRELDIESKAVVSEHIATQYAEQWMGREGCSKLMRVALRDHVFQVRPASIVQPMKLTW